MTRSQSAAIGAHALHARYGGKEITAKARATANERLDERLTLQYGLDRSAADYPKKLAHARKAYFGQLRLKSAKAQAERGVRQ